MPRKTSDLPPIIPSSLQSDREIDVGLLIARGGLVLSILLFVGSLAATLTLGGGGKVLGSAAVREEVPLEDFKAHLDAIRTEYGSDFTEARNAVDSKTPLDTETKYNYVARLTAFRDELTKIHVPDAGKEEVLRLVSELDTLLTTLSS